MNVAKYICCVLLVGVVVPSTGANECAQYLDVGDKLSFGRLLIGAPKKNLGAPLTTSKNCVELPRNNYYDCEYTDQEGVSYLFEGRVLLRKQVDLSRYKAPLVADLHVGELVQSVVQKIRKMPVDFPIFFIAFGPGDGFTLSTGNCIVGSNGVAWALELIFDRNGALVSMGAGSASK